MLVSNLIEKLKKFNPDAMVMCQVVGERSAVWNRVFELNPIPNTQHVVLTISCPGLDDLPPINLEYK